MTPVRRVVRRHGMQDHHVHSFGVGVNGEEMIHGQLYQLPAVPGLKPGACVRIDGPYDTFGIVLHDQGESELSKKLRSGHHGHMMICYSHGDSGKPDLKNMHTYSIRGTGRGQKDKMAYTTVSY